jgi:hypothetical protein
VFASLDLPNNERSQPPDFPKSGIERAGQPTGATARRRVPSRSGWRPDRFRGEADAAATTQAEQAAGERDQARGEAQKARETVRRLEDAEVARKARGRLRRAWDGWRGR